MWARAIFEIDAEYYVLQEDYDELEEENKKLKKECEENDYLVEDNARWMKKCEEKTMEIKKLKEELKWWKDLVHKAKEFEYDEDGMDYIWQNTKI